MDIGVMQFKQFFLVLARVAALLYVAPVFSSLIIPARYKLLLGFFVALVFYPVVGQFLPKIPEPMMVYGLLVVQQILLGLIIGFLATIIFTTFQLAGQFFSVQMGFGVNEVLDPMSQVQVPIVGQLMAVIAILVFLEVGAHRLLLEGLYDSFAAFENTSLMELTTQQKIFGFLKSGFVNMFVAALKISLPLIAVFLFMEISMGLMTKASPQMNILMLGFPLKIIVGLILLVALLRVMMQYVIPKIYFGFFEELGRFFLSWKT